MKEKMGIDRFCPVCCDLYLSRRTKCQYCHKVIWNFGDYNKKRKKNNKIGDLL